MQKRFFYNVLLITGLAFLFQSYSGGGGKYGGGSPGGYSGSPGDAKDCVICHGGSATVVTGWITSDVPLSGYVPGAGYTITVTLTGSGKKGFECSPQSPAGALMGTLTAGSGTHLVNGNKAVTQNSSPNTNPYSWSFGWTAPAAGSGEVTFYAAFTVNKPVTKLCTLVVTESTSSLAEAGAGAGGISVFPNPARSSFSLSYHLANPGEVAIALYNLQGAELSGLFQAQLDAGRQHQLLQLPASMPGGLYLVKITAAGNTSYKKIIVQ